MHGKRMPSNAGATHQSSDDIDAGLIAITVAAKAAMSWHSREIDQSVHWAVAARRCHIRNGTRT